MSKKKKFAGKKTKLAEHALTHVLEQEKSEAAEALGPLEAPSSSLTLAQAVQALRNDQLNLELPLSDDHPIPTQHQLEAANAYLALLQELEGVRELLRAPNLPARPRAVDQKPRTLPNPEIIKYSLQVIGHTLREIKTFMG
jgi:hypothetical protein